MACPCLRPQAAGKAEEVCHPWPAVGEPGLRGGPEGGGLVLKALLGLMGRIRSLVLFPGPWA